VSDAFSPPDAAWETEDDRLDQIALDRGVRLTRVALWFVGACYALLGVIGGPLMGMATMADPTLDPDVAQIMGGVMMGVMLVMGLGFGLVNFVAAWGLGGGGKWAWILTIILGAIYAPSACLPFGAVMLWGMLNDDTRKLFLG
jgi:hypothetical protein